MDILEYFDYKSEVSLISVCDQDCKSSPNSSSDLVKENEISEKVNIIKNVFCCFKIKQNPNINQTDEDQDADTESDQDADTESDQDADTESDQDQEYQYPNPTQDPTQDPIDRTEIIPGVAVFGSNSTGITTGRILFDDNLVSISRRNSESNLLTEYYNNSRKSSIDSTFTFITMLEQERH